MAPTDTVPRGSAASRLRFHGRRRLLDSSLAPVYLAHRRGYADRRITDDVTLVLDGFPRSANSYFRQVLLLSQGDRLVLAGHAHSAGLLLQAASLRLPTVVIVRDPAHVMASYLQFAPALRPQDVLRTYIHFHRRILDALPRLLVVDFAAVTSAPDQVISSINERFGTQLDPYLPSEENEDRVRRRLEEIGRAKHGPSGAEHRVSRPSTKRRTADDVVETLQPSDRKLLSSAHGVYSRITSHQGL